MVTKFGVTAVIEVDGWELEPEIVQHIEQVAVDEHSQLPPMFSITLLDPYHDILDRSGVRVGATIEISMVAQTEHDIHPVVRGDVVSVECDYDLLGARIVARGYAASHRLHRGRRTRTFMNVTDSEMVRTVASEAGIELGRIEATADVYEHVAQANQSDWDFITARARQIGFEVSIVDDKLDFGPPRLASQAPTLAETDMANDPTDPRQLVFGKNLVAFHGRLSAAEQVAEVEVRSWDSTSKKPVVASASASTVAAELDLADPSTMAGFFGNQTFVSVHRALATEPEASLAAKAIAERIASSFAEVEGVCRGHPDLRAGSAVSIQGVGEDFQGKYVLTHVRHVINRDGYQTHITASGRHDRSLLGVVAPDARRAAALGGGSSTARLNGLVRGIVDDNADPQGLGRVRVRLPWLNDEFSSTWAPVMQLGAGPESGTFFLPEVNDEVLVGFEHGEVDRPIVVGGLFNGMDKPLAYDRFLDNGAVHRRSIVSRLGHQIALSDDASNESGITLVTKDATVGVALNAKDKKLILSSHGEVSIESSSDMKLKGTNITIEASGQLVLKGAQIKLN